MKTANKDKKEGISLKTAHLVMMIVTLIVLGLLLFELFRAYNVYKKMNAATEDYIVLSESTDNLMAASDYLTDKAQLFCIMQNEEDLLAYFDEVNITRRRDKAIEEMKKIAGESEAFSKLQDAMNRSVSLMDSEYHSMRLVCDACGITNMPHALLSVTLTDKEKAMSSEEKIKYATELVHDIEYYMAKNSISESLEKCTAALINDTHAAQEKYNDLLKKRLMIVSVLIVIQSVSMIFILWMTSYLGINPLLKGVQKIRENSEMPIVGSYEFRYLAKTYNKMYEAFKESIENLNYDASHDKLTGLYNRSGYEVLKSSFDLHSTTVLAISCDNFREINSKYGHDTGDKILKKIADALKKTFRHEDYICRVDSDKFAVFMLHMEDQRKDLIKLKAGLINNRLSDVTDGLPPVSVSFGVAFGMSEDSMESFIIHADEALERTKKEDNKGCYFYDMK